MTSQISYTNDLTDPFVETKRSWIYRKLAEKDALVGPPVVKQFVDGEGFAYLGRSHRLLIVPDGDDVRLDRGRFLLPAHLLDDGPAVMRRWYRRTGSPWLRRRVQPWAARMGFSDVTVAVTDLGYRWGSAERLSKLALPGHETDLAETNQLLGGGSVSILAEPLRGDLAGDLGELPSRIGMQR